MATRFKKEIPCEKRINVEYLIDRYSRENSKPSSIIPKSVTDIVSYYYPKMNGHTFTWNINNLNENLPDNDDPIDSNVFDIGLANKFFLSLKCMHSSNLVQYRGVGRGGGGYAYRGRGRRTFTHRWMNNIQYLSDSNDDQLNDVSHDSNDKQFLLSLISFPLPNTYIQQILHVELYCPQAKQQYSAIWSQQHNHDDHDEFKEIKHGWIVNYASKYPLNELTFICKVNVLKVVTDDRYNTDHGFHHYHYVARLFSDNLRFIWDIAETSMVQNMIKDDVYPGLIQYHSDIYYDMFQLQIGKESGVVFFQIQVCGFPQNAEKIAVRLELFAMDKNSERDKIKILSNIAVFSYQSPIYEIPSAKANILIDLLSQYQSVSILCHANISQGYDATDSPIEIINDKQPQPLEETNVSIVAHIADHQSVNIEAGENKMGLDETLQEEDECQLDGKWLEYPSKSFTWNMADIAALNHICDNNPDYSVDSKIFELFGYKWYINIFKSFNKALLEIRVRCLLSKGELHCRVTVEIPELNQIMAHYERITANNWHKNYPEMLINPADIKDLKTMTIKLKVELMKDQSGEANYKMIDTEKKEIDITKKTDEYIEENKTDVSLNEQSKAKWLKYPSETFVWSIRDRMILDKIQYNPKRFDSDLFELFGHIFFVSVHKPPPQYPTLAFTVNCILESGKGSLYCAIRMEIEELNESIIYYDRYEANKWNDRSKFLEVDRVRIQNLRSITIKIEIGMIKDESTDSAQDEREKFNGINYQNVASVVPTVINIVILFVALFLYHLIAK